MEAPKQMIMTQFKSNDPADYERVKAYIEDYMMRCLRPDEHAVQTMFNKLKQKPYTWDKENTWNVGAGICVALMKAMHCLQLVTVYTEHNVLLTTTLWHP